MVWIYNPGKSPKYGLGGYIGAPIQQVGARCHFDCTVNNSGPGCLSILLLIHQPMNNGTSCGQPMSSTHLSLVDICIRNHVIIWVRLNIGYRKIPWFIIFFPIKIIKHFVVPLISKEPHMYYAQQLSVHPTAAPDFKAWPLLGNHSTPRGPGIYTIGTPRPATRVHAELQHCSKSYLIHNPERDLTLGRVPIPRKITSWFHGL